MKFLFVAIVVVLGVACVLCDEKYTTKYDNIDLDEIIKNDRLMRKYIDCVMEKGRCTPDGQELKTHISEGLQTGCAKCTDKQKDGVKKIVRHLSGNKKEWWAEVKGKYDPNGAFKEKYADWTAKEGITA